jgi:hypothetical protein
MMYVTPLLFLFNTHQIKYPIRHTRYGCEKEEISFGVESSVTHRDKQSQESIERRLLALDITSSNGDSNLIPHQDSRESPVNTNGHFDGVVNVDHTAGVVQT